jgi:hypothetical protein
MSISIDHSNSGQVLLKTQNDLFDNNFVVPKPFGAGDSFFLYSGYSIDGISGLRNCLNQEQSYLTTIDSVLDCVTTFIDADLVNENKSYSYKNYPYNTNSSIGSLLIGQNSNSVNNFELALAPGSFVDNGDVQYSEFSKKDQYYNSEWNNFIILNLEDDSFSYIEIDLLSSNNNYLSSFNLTILVKRESTSSSIINESLITYKNQNNNFELQSDLINNKLYIKVKDLQGGLTKWYSNIKINSLIAKQIYFTLRSSINNQEIHTVKVPNTEEGIDLFFIRPTLKSYANN